jgi:hypothetical protein
VLAELLQQHPAYKKHRYPCWIVIIKALDGLVGDGLCTPLRGHDIYRNVGAVT